MKTERFEVAGWIIVKADGSLVMSQHFGAPNFFPTKAEAETSYHKGHDCMVVKAKIVCQVTYREPKVKV